MADFAFATCLPGMEPAVKREVARRRPGLRFAYSRPGLITFRAERPVGPDDESGSVFARVWGRSIGAADDVDTARALLAAFAPMRTHVFAREQLEADDPKRAASDAAVAQWRTRLGADNAAAQAGELVADVIVAPGEPAWIGVHQHDEMRPAEPGGMITVAAERTAPSRAYEKCEEAIAWARLPVERGQVALEIGAAPGGAVLALAKRGLDVWAVDTGELADVVRGLRNVHHLPMKVGAVRWEQLPPRIDWLLVDVNLAPQVALHEVARLVPRLKPHLRGAIITLKMNDWTFVDELPALADRIRAFGLPDVRMRHLPSNRREVCAVALR